MIRSGELRHSIVIESEQQGSNQYHEVLLTWVPFYTGRAKVKAISGKEYFELHAQNVEVDYVIQMRYFPGISSKMRVQWKGLVLDIIDVIDVDNKQHELQLTCKLRQ